MWGGWKQINSLYVRDAQLPSIDALFLLEYWILNPALAIASFDLKTINSEFPEDSNTSGKSAPQNLPRILEETESPSCIMT